MARTPALFLCAVWPFATTLAQTPTWHADISCIVFTHCAPCHHEGGAGHFSLTSYGNAFFARNEIKGATRAGYMPPWPPDPGYRSLAHERVLTQEEIDLIAAWVDGGAPEGDASNALPPPVFTNTPAIDPPDLTAIMEDFVVPSSTRDLYRCFVLPVDNPTDRFITGLEVVPGNTEMVHHVLVFQDTSGQARVLDANDPAPGYTSFGGIGVQSAKLIGVWVPGAEPFFTPSGMGIKLLANADIVIQVHYPATSRVQLDSTRVNLKLTSAPGTRDLSIDPILDHVRTITNGPLVIPANTVRTFNARFTVPLPVTITAIGPHAHLVCVSMRSFAVVPSGDTIPLVDIPKWDFRWQGMYQFRQPVFLPTGSIVYGEAVYDNTANNPNNPNSPPQVVRLGEATTDEMMLFYFAWTPGMASDADIVVDTVMHQAHYMDCSPGTILGIDRVPDPLPLDAWPSPARDVLHVRSGRSVGTVRLLDASGRAVLIERTTGTVHSLDVSALARGPYVVEVRPPGHGLVQRLKVLLE